MVVPRCAPGMIEKEGDLCSIDLKWVNNSLPLEAQKW